MVWSTSTHREAQPAFNLPWIGLIVRIAFAGTPEVAVESLAAMLASQHEIALVITRPDAPTGRGKVITPSPVAQFADAHGIPVLKTNDVAAVDVSQLDAVIVVAFGAMIPKAQLDAPKFGWLNLHFSLLPKWRGAAPVQRALFAGDTETGITIFRIDQGLDTGPVVGQAACHIGPDENAGELFTRLIKLGNDELLAVLENLSTGHAVFVEQDTQGISHAAKIATADARVDWSTPATQIHNQIRACTPVPGAWTNFADLRVKLSDSSLAPAVTDLLPGQAVVRDGEVLVGTASHAITIGQLQPAGKTKMLASAWLNGIRGDVTFE
jgi:methionyl-tRNA formyltransferase